MLTKKLIFALMFILMFAVSGLQADGDVARGQELSEECVDCHGEDGKGDEEVPGIAGMYPAEHVKKLADFMSGAVESEMIDYVEGLTEQDMADLAAYYATLP